MTENVRKPEPPGLTDDLVSPVGRGMAVHQLPMWTARSSTEGVGGRAERGARAEGPVEQLRVANTPGAREAWQEVRVSLPSIQFRGYGLIMNL